MTTISNYRYKLRRDTTGAWAAANPVLYAGEPGVEVVDSDTNRIKFGDGATAWNSLPYFDADAVAGLGAEIAARIAGDAALDTRLDAIEVLGSLATDAELIAEISARIAANNSLDARLDTIEAIPNIPLAQRGAANGVATLGADSKIPSAQLPALAIGETFTVASQAAMLALTAQRGDMAVRTDLNPHGFFLLTSDSPTTLADWVQITAPGAVVSVDGQTGAVDLSGTYVGTAGDQTAAGVKDWTGAQRNGSGDPVYHVRSKAFNGGLWSTAAERRATIQACFTAMAAAGVGGTAVFPPGAIDLSGGTILLPNAYSNVHTTYRLIGNNTRLTTTSAHPILADDMPTDNNAAVTRANRRFIVEGIHFQGSSLIGQVGLRIVGSYLSEIRHCSFQYLEDGLDLIFCLAVTVNQCGFHSQLNNGQRHRYGMEIDNGIGTFTPLWSGASFTNSNGNCPTVSKCRDYAAIPEAIKTVTNKQLVTNVVTLTTSVAHALTVGRWALVKGLGSPFDGLWKIQSTPTTTTFTYNRTNADVASTAVAGTPRTVTDAAITVANPTLTSATAAFLLSDIGATVAHANYPGGQTTITEIINPTQVNTADGASGALTGQTVTITRPTTVQMGQKSQISFEAISEIIVDGIVNEGGQALTGIYYDQGGSTTAKGITVRDAHPEHRPLVGSIVLVGTGGGHVVIDGGTWTQGTCMLDASGFTTGIIHWHNQSVLFGKWRAGASSWCFQMSGGLGTDPTLTSWWDGAPAIYFGPILRHANGTTEPGHGNAGCVAFKGNGLYSAPGAHYFLSQEVSPKMSMVVPKGVSIGLWNAAANPATLTNDTVFFWKDETTGALTLVVKDSAGVSYSVPIDYKSAAILSSSLVQTVTVAGTTYTLLATDPGKMLKTTSGSATTVTVPPFASVAIPVGSVLNWHQDGAGQITFAAGAGVTLENFGSKFKSGGQRASGGLWHKATNVWVPTGELVA